MRSRVAEEAFRHLSEKLATVGWLGIFIYFFFLGFVVCVWIFFFLIIIVLSAMQPCLAGSQKHLKATFFSVVEVFILHLASLQQGLSNL